MSVTIKDINKVPDILQELEKLRAEIQVGVPMYPKGGKEVVIRANINEYGGTIEVTEAMRHLLRGKGIYLKSGTTKMKIPERSFVRATFDEEEKTAQMMVKSGVGSVLTGQKKADALLNEIGKYLANAVKNKIRKHGLVDTGEMLNSITYKVAR